MSSASSEALSGITDTYINYKCYPTDEKFLLLDNFNIVDYLFSNEVLNDIECRKIAVSKNVVEFRAAIYAIILTKDSKTVKKILETFGSRLHPFQNPRILQRIFSYLKYADIKKCKRVCADWKEMVDSIFISKFDEVNLQQFLLMKLLANNDIIKRNKRQNLQYQQLYQVKTEKIEMILEPDEKKSSVFQMMLAINPENVETMLARLEIRKDVSSYINNSLMNVLCTTENKTDNLIANALRNHTVLSNIFQFLSLENIKSCRTVCRTWNSVSELFFRKISKIKFDSKFLPKDFLNVSKYLPYPDLHFKAFKFRLDVEKEYLNPHEKCSEEELSEFFTKFGMNIRSLDLCWLKDIHSCLSLTTNLTELIFMGETWNSYSDPHSKNDTMLMIPWNALRSIKSLCLTDIVIKIESDHELTRITPVKVRLVEVSFFVGDRFEAEIKLNDYIDFTKATDVHINVGYTFICQQTLQIQQFDWAKDNFVAKEVLFSNIRFVNAVKSKSTIDCLKLCNGYSFSEKNCMSIKQMILEKGSFSLAALPSTLEKLAIREQNSADIDISEPIFSPNLNYLSYGMGNELNFLSHFHNCPNLTDMEITGMNSNSIDIRWLPRSIKKLKVELCSGHLNVFGGLANEHFDLDLLILDYVASYHLNYLKFDKLRPKVLVLEFGCFSEDATFPYFIRRNKNMDKIYVQFRLGALPRVFRESQLSKIVDKESDYYVFSNERGKAITPEEFFAVQKSLDMKTAMKGFWNTTIEQEEQNNQQLAIVQEYNEGGFTDDSEDDEFNDNDYYDYYGG